MPVSKTRKHTKKKKGSNSQPTAPVSALSSEYPLECCVINSNWQDAKMANVIIVRKTGATYTLVGFLVDICGVGLKDSFVHKGISRLELKYLLEHASSDGVDDCPLPLAQELVYGGLAWARQHGFRTPAEATRYLKILPAPLDEPDTSRFGTDDGSPLIVI